MRYFSLLPVLFFVACSTGNCRSQGETERVKAETAVNPALQETSQKASTALDRVKVYKYDGTLQCSQGAKIPLDQMQKELKNITVHSSENKNDGLMHIQVCASPTGMANVYEIDKTQLAAAKKLGFKEWIF